MISEKINLILEEFILWLSKKDLEYADVRYTKSKIEHITVNNLENNDYSLEHSEGFGVRVYIEGALGFASGTNLDEIYNIAEKAISIAEASKLVQKNSIQLSSKEKTVGEYYSSWKVDPFDVNVKDKISLLTDAVKIMENTSLKISKAEATMDFIKESKLFKDTLGSNVLQHKIISGAGLLVITSNDNSSQVRTYPGGLRGNHLVKGFEHIAKLDLLSNAKRISEEATELLEAEPCPSGEFDLIIASNQLTLQIHESIGHAIEGDRILGHEAGFFGTSFINRDMIGNYKYGSEHVNIVADATIEGGLGSFEYDDDGVRSQNIPIIENGILKNVLLSRDVANAFNKKSNGCSRAQGWNRLPIVRMTNINLLPGTHSLEELIEKIEYGFYFKGNKSWSIDDRRLNFQFGSEIAYEIKKGKLTGKIFKNPIYRGKTPDFWNSCDGVSNKDHWSLLGTLYCGKAEPGQDIYVGHGSSPSLFRKVKVGV